MFNYITSYKFIFKFIFLLKYFLIYLNKKLNIFIFLFFSILPVSAFSETDQLTEILNKAVDYAQSGPARGFCLLAIVGAGYLWLARGAIPKSWAVGIMGGAGFIFGASYIAETVLGVSA